MQVEVITRHAVRNYGSVLQAIATKELLERAGSRVRFVDYRQQGYDDTGWSYANRGSARTFSLPGRAAYALLRDAGVRKIGREFEAFIADELTLTDTEYRSAAELAASDEFSEDSFFCAGSDQVWNAEYNVDNTPYYLEFAPKEAARFSLASSIGAPSLPPAEEARLVQALGTFVGVSVRESSSAAYLRSLGIPAEWHVDPTLGVEPAFWRRFCAGEAVGSPYVLVYQLNGAPGFNSVVDAVSAALRIPVKRIEYWRGPRSLRSPRVVLPTMQEFVRLFRDAAFVVSDSFHGTSFSTTFGRPFVVVAPPKYSDRISSLLELTQQSERMVRTPGEAVAIATPEDPLEGSEARLAPERMRLQQYLSRVFAQ